VVLEKRSAQARSPAARDRRGSPRAPPCRACTPIGNRVPTARPEKGARRPRCRPRAGQPVDRSRCVCTTKRAASESCAAGPTDARPGVSGLTAAAINFFTSSSRAAASSGVCAYRDSASPRVHSPRSPSGVSVARVVPDGLTHSVSPVLQEVFPPPALTYSPLPNSWTTA
jgi:hypothetical protein